MGMKGILELARRAHEDAVKAAQKLKEIQTEVPNEQMAECCQTCKARVIGESVDNGIDMVFCTECNKFMASWKRCDKHEFITNPNMEGEDEALAKVFKIQEDGCM